MRSVPSAWLTAVYVPLGLLTGWIHAVATVNPFTALLAAARDLIDGDAGTLGAAIAISLGLIAVFGVWALRSLRRAEAAGG